MISSKELRALASALMSTSEYKAMINAKSKLKAYPQIYSQLNEMDRARSRIMKSNMPMDQKQRQIMSEMKKNEHIMSNPDVTAFTRAMETYRKMYKECINSINRITDSNLG